MRDRLVACREEGNVLKLRWPGPLPLKQVDGSHPWTSPGSRARRVSCRDATRSNGELDMLMASDRGKQPVVLDLANNT